MPFKLFRSHTKKKLEKIRKKIEKTNKKIEEIQKKKEAIITKEAQTYTKKMKVTLNLGEQKLLEDLLARDVQPKEIKERLKVYKEITELQREDIIKKDTALRLRKDALTYGQNIEKVQGQIEEIKLKQETTEREVKEQNEESVAKREAEIQAKRKLKESEMRRGILVGVDNFIELYNIDSESAAELRKIAVQNKPIEELKEELSRKEKEVVERKRLHDLEKIKIGLKRRVETFIRENKILESDANELRNILMENIPLQERIEKIKEKEKEIKNKEASKHKHVTSLRDKPPVRTEKSESPIYEVPITNEQAKTQVEKKKQIDKKIDQIYKQIDKLNIDEDKKAQLLARTMDIDQAIFQNNFDDADKILSEIMQEINNLPRKKVKKIRKLPPRKKVRKKEE